jgi:hypothetical protein
VEDKYNVIAENVHHFTKPYKPMTVNERLTLSKELSKEAIDTLAVAKKTLQFMRTNGLTVTEFCEKVE